MVRDTRYALRMLAPGMMAFALASPIVHAQGAAVEATPCDVLSRPMEFNGKTVRVSGRVQTGLDDFVLRAPGCSGTASTRPPAATTDAIAPVSWISPWASGATCASAANTAGPST